MKRAGGLRFWAATVLLVLTAAFSVAGTVKSGNGSDGAKREEYYLEKETRLAEDVREYLKEQGFLYSGVTVTRVVNEDGGREYKVSVHHRDIGRLTGQEREELAFALAEFAFTEEGCGFRFEFSGGDMSPR
ncbi:MAG: hypothetical protein NC541_08275 [bacterium]|nr:hypothetical protein [bacterium]